MASKACAKLTTWLNLGNVIKMAAILCEIRNMATKAYAKLDTWRPRPVQNKKHGRYYIDVIIMAALILILRYMRDKSYIYYIYI